MKSQVFNRTALLLTKPIKEDSSEEDSLNISQMSRNMREKRENRQKLMGQLVEILNDDDEDVEKMEFNLALNDGLSPMILNELEREHHSNYQKVATAVKPNKYLQVVFMDSFQEVSAYYDKYPFLQQRKQLMLLLTWNSYICQSIIKNFIFESVVLLVIIWNSLMLAMMDPTSNTETPLQLMFDEFFLIFYTAEMMFKIFAMGFLLNRDAYLRDPWNILDFTIISTGYLPYVLNSNTVNLSALRALRVLRPLRTINKIKALRDIVQCLFAAITLLRDSVIVLVFFFTVFAIGGLQLYMGLLKRRCMWPEGYEADESSHIPFCAQDGDCPGRQICAKMLKNPDWGITNFDTFGWAFLMVYQICTLEGWSDIMRSIMKTFQSFMAIYFLVIVLIGAFFLLNLLIAIIKVKFTEQQENKDQPTTEDGEDQGVYDLDELRMIGVYKKRNQTDRYDGAVLEEYFGYNSKYICFPKNQIETILNEALIKPIQTIPTDTNSPAQCVTNSHNNIVSSKVLLENNKIRGAPESTPNNFKVFTGGIQEKSTYQLQSKAGKSIKFAGMRNIAKKQQPQPLKQKNIMNRSSIKHASISQMYASKHSSKLTDDDDILELLNDRNSHSRKSSKLNVSMIGKSPLSGLLPEIQENDFLKPPVSTAKSFRVNTKNAPKVDGSLTTTNRLSRLEPKNNLTIQHSLFRGQHIPKQKTEDFFLSSDDEVLEVAEVDIQKNIADLGLEEFFKVPTKPNIEIFPPLRRQERQAVTYHVDQQVEDDDLTKEQLILKEKLQNVSNLITGLLNKPEEVFDQDVLSSYVERQRQKVLEADQRFRKSTRIQMTYELDPLMLKRCLTRAITTKSTFSKQRRTIDSKLTKKKSLSSLTQSSEELKQVLNHNREVVKKPFNKNKFLKNYVKLTWTYDNIKQLIHKDVENTNIEVEDHKIEYEKQIHDDIYINRGRITTVWSGDDILLSYALQLYAIKYLNIREDEINIWLRGWSGVLTVFRKYVRMFVQSNIYEIFILTAVILNTIGLCLNGLMPSRQQYILDSLNLTCTIIFTIDMSLKLIALAFDYVRDAYNIFDGITVILSLVELGFSTTSGKSDLSALKAVRTFRVLRVLRVTRLIRSLRYMAVILDVIGRQMESIAYIFILLCLFMFIFILLGMQVFGGYFDNQIRQNYNSFFNAFICVFQLVTLENWNDLLHAALRSSQLMIISLIYLIVWIFIGNYIFLNLFLSILLDGFENKEQEDDVKELEKELEITENLKMEFPQDTKLSLSSAGTTNFAKKKTLGFQYFTEQGMTEYSLFIFSQDNPIRRLCYRIVKDDKFEWVIFVAIILTSTQLIIDTYITYDYDTALLISIIFTSLFTVEATMKIIAFGFVLDRHSYLTESWSQLDFFIVIVSWIDVGVTTVNLRFVRILRLLRTLRPLRFISHNIQMKLVVTALLESVSGIMNVVLVIVLVWMMFAILAIELMQGKMNYCSLPSNSPYTIYEVNRKLCESIDGAYWTLNDMNFDNIINAMISLFVLSTFENWPGYGYNWVDGGVDGPVLDNNPYFMFFTVAFILIGSMFLINLFFGVISLSYSMAESKSKNKLLSQEQANWIEIQRLIVASKPFFPSQFPPDNKYRAICYFILKNKFFEIFIMICIVTNILTMAMAYDTSPSGYDQILTNMNLAFTALFIFEAFIKLIAYGAQGYFMSGWNQFDFFVVVTSILDLILNQIGSGIQSLKVGPQIARIFRVLRVTRLLRLIKSFDGLRKLIQTAIFALPQLLNVLSLLMLCFFIFSILGCQLFGGIQGDSINSSANFNNFLNSFLILFTSSTGENWYLVMFDTTRPPNGNGLNVFFWVAFIIIMPYVMLNLFVLVVLQQFEENYINENNPLQNFSELEQEFLASWVNQTEQFKGQKMHASKLVPLIMDLRKPLGLNVDEECQNQLKLWRDIQQTAPTFQEEKVKEAKFRAIHKKDAAKRVMEMDIHQDSQGYVYYHQILFHFMKQYSYKNREKLNKGDDFVMNEEAQSKKKIRSILDERPQTTVNPIVQHLFVSLSFKVWISYLEQHKQKHLDREGSYFSSSYGDSRSEQMEIEPRDLDTDQDEEHSAGRNFINVPNNEIYFDKPIINDDPMEEYRSQFRQFLVDEERQKSEADIEKQSKTNRSQGSNMSFVIQNQVFIQNNISVNGQVVLDTQVRTNIVPSTSTIKVTTVTEQTFQIFSP